MAVFSAGYIMFSAVYFLMEHKEEKIRVLLVNPPITISKSAGFESHIPPLGTAYIAAVLEKNGFEARILDALIEGDNVFEPAGAGIVRVGLPETEITKRLRSYKPKIVGIGCTYTAYAADAYRIAELAKQNLPEAVVCFGGAHASVAFDDVLKNANVDLVAIGEGELTFLEIAERVMSGKNLQGIAGTACRKSGKVVKNTPRPYIKNLDELPLPARHLMPIERHLRNWKVYPFAKRRPVLEMITSRGCPGKCTFCSIHAVWGHEWRGRSAKNVVNEIEYLAKKYGVKEFSMLDDNISADPKRFEEILDEIARRKLDICWETPNGIAIWTLNERLLEKMKKTGYYRAKFGIESGCGDTLRYIGKPINLEKAKKIIDACNRLGIWTSSSFVIGFPNENAESIGQTVKFALESGLDFARFLIAQPYGGTQLCKDFEKDSLLEEEFKQGSSAYNTAYNTKHFGAGELNRMRIEAESRFLRRKIRDYATPRGFAKYLWPKINSAEGFLYFAGSAFAVAKAKVLGKFL